MTLKEFFKRATPNVESKALWVATYIVSRHRAPDDDPTDQPSSKKLLNPKIRFRSVSRVF